MGLVGNRPLCILCAGLAVLAMLWWALGPQALPERFKLRRALSGWVVFPEDRSYTDAVKQVNAFFDDRRPAAIVYCLAVADVQTSVRWVPLSLPYPLASPDPYTTPGPLHPRSDQVTRRDGLASILVTPPPPVRSVGGCTRGC